MKTIICLVILLFLPLACLAKAEVIKSNWPLELIVEPDKKEYKLGDSIVLTCKVRNVSKAPISFFRDTNPTHINLIITSQDGGKCRVADSSQVMIGSNDEVTLYAGEEFEYSLQGKILEGMRKIPKGEYKGEGYEDVLGFYIQFPTWSILLDNGPGKYEISAIYKDGSWVETADPKFLADNKPTHPSKREISKKLKGKWRGKLVSDAVTVEIVKKD